MLPFPASVEGAIALTGGGAVLTALGCGVRGLPGRGAGSVLTELSGSAVLVVNDNIVVVVEGVVVFVALCWGVETFPGAGGDAVFKALSTEVGILPAGGGGTVLDSFWEGASFLPENGAGAVLTELGLEVVVVFLDGETTAFAVEAGGGIFLV